MYICGRGHQSREPQAKLTSVTKQLASYYALLVAAPSGFEKELKSRENCAQNQSDSKTGLKKISGGRRTKAM